MLSRSVRKRDPGALEERPAAPQHHRRRQRELPPGEYTLVHHVADLGAPDHLGHGDEEERQAQAGADPESPGDVLEVDVLDRVQCDGARLKRHAADRAVARRVADDFRMHRAGPLHVRARGHHGWRRTGSVAVVRTVGVRGVFLRGVPVCGVIVGRVIVSVGLHRGCLRWSD